MMFSRHVHEAAVRHELVVVKLKALGFADEEARMLLKTADRLELQWDDVIMYAALSYCEIGSHSCNLLSTAWRGMMVGLSA